MSNLTRLQTNNTNLQTCIDKANALPDIDDPFYSKSRSGSISVSSGAYNGELASVTGLGFEPKIIIISLLKNSVTASAPGLVIWACYAEEDAQVGDIWSASATLMGSTVNIGYSHITVSPNSDGFVVKTNNNTIRMDGNYKYVAFA